MKYYAHINSKDILTGIDMSKIVADEYGSEDVKNIEVDKTLYDNKQKYGIEYYTYKDGEIILNPEYSTIELNNKKEELITKNDRLRDEKLLEGVTYNNVLFDSDTDQKTNLLATYQMLLDKDTITWYGKDNKALLCTNQDLLTIGKLIVQLHSYCWNRNAEIKLQINNANTLEDLNSIDISYEFEGGEYNG